MAKFRIDRLAELARQMQFTPHDVRAAQLASAEDLLHGLDPAKAYPLDFVTYRITGYRPRGSVDDDLLTGLALQHDLGLLIERVSDTLDVYTQAITEPVLDIDTVCERFNVTSKTIQRWRRKGLPARKFFFPDGKRRVGFLISSVERFFAGQADEVAPGTNFSQLTGAEREYILKQARRLAVRCRCGADEIARRIARRINRSPLTILHTLRKHDEEYPEQAVLARAAAPISEDDRHRVLRGCRRGLTLAALAKRIGRSRSAVYRVVLEERVGRLGRRKVRFIDDPLYHQDDAASAVEAILAGTRDELLGGADNRPEDDRVPRDLPAYLAALYRTPLLTPAGERAHFLAFNFHKFNFVSARRRLDPQLARARDLSELENHLRLATEVKNAIVQANLRLVVSVARKHLRPGLSFMELISDGNLTLMRAAESFDFHRGHRFSTYATLALMKGFARSVPEMLSGKARARGATSDDGVLAGVPDTRFVHASERMVAREEVRQLLSRLDDRERSVVLAHYGLEGRTGPATYEQVGRLLGMTKQRVRQIEQSALAKLRGDNGADPVEP